MDNIIKTRKTVKYYIYFNIGFMALSTTILFYNIFSTEQNIKLYKEALNVPSDFSTIYLLLGIVFFMILLLGFILLIYRLIYGILLKRLKKNHKELEQLDK